MGHGSWRYRRRRQTWKDLLAAVEGLLYLAFLADCFVLIASATPDYFPPGGISLIPILLAAAAVDRLRDR